MTEFALGVPGDAKVLTASCFSLKNVLVWIINYIATFILSDPLWTFFAPPVNPQWLKGCFQLKGIYSPVHSIFLKWLYFSLAYKTIMAKKKNKQHK